MTDEITRGRLRHLLGPYIVLRGNRDFALVFTAQALSVVIDWLYVVALFVLAYALTHSAAVVALLTLMRLLPYAILLPISGAITDRFDRKTLMTVAAAGRAACIIGLLAVHSRGTLPLAFPLVFATTLLASLFRPALLSSLPSVVPERHLVQANSMLSQVDMASFGAGPAIAGFILLVSNTRVALLVSAIGLLAAATAVALARIPPHADDQPAAGIRWLDHVQGGLRFLLGEYEGTLAAVALTLTGLTVFGGAYWALVVVLDDTQFHLGGSGVGFLNAVYALGGILGGFLVGPVIARRGITVLFIAGAALSSIAEALWAISPAGALPFIFWFLVGLADAFAKIIAATIIQTSTPRYLLGRVFGAFESGLIFAMVIGTLVVAPLISVLGVRAAGVIIAMAGFSLLLIAIPRLLKLERAVGPRVFLHQVPVLNLLSFHLLDDLVSRLQIERFAPGEIVIREGDPGDRFYVVRRGSAVVLTHRGDEGDVPVSTLGCMDYFGETALLRGAPRNATIRSLEPLELYSLTREDFDELLRDSEEFDAALRDRSDARDVARRNQLMVRF